jgi:hypothetical protein
MLGRQHLQHRQLGDRGQSVRVQVERRRAGPGALHGHVLEIIAHQLADPRAAVDMRDDLEQEVRRRQPLGLGREVQGAVLVAHGAGGDADRAVVQRADQRIGLDRQRRLRQLLREAPQLASAGDRRVVVQEHLVGVAAGLAPPAHRDHLAALGVVAEAGRIRHADELVIHHRLDDLQRLRHHPAQRLRVGAVADDEVLAVDEAVGPGREGRAGQRHGEGGLPHGLGIHCAASSLLCAAQD